jgi:hypothetical protein
MTNKSPKITPRTTSLAAALLALLALAACVQITRNPEPRTETSSIKLGSAKSVSANLSMGAGEMKVRGGATDLINATFSYNDPEQKPKINYVDSTEHGQLTIEQPGGANETIGNNRYAWDVQLNNNVTTELHVQIGAGKLDLQLGQLPLASLHVQMGAGTSVVDLAGNWKRDVDVHLQGGVGSLTVRLPRNVGVRAYVQGGLGSLNSTDFKQNGDAYVNDQFGKSPVTITVKIEGGIGKIKLELAGGPAV